jgi:hypothetical protein
MSTSGTPSAHTMALQLVSSVMTAISSASWIVSSADARVSTACGTTTCAAQARCHAWRDARTAQQHG